MENSKVKRVLLVGSVVAVVTLAAWWAWIGWDTEYTVDPVTSSTSGPYEVWQVVGLVLSLLLIAAVGGWTLGPGLVAPVMTVVFTVAYGWRAATTDDSGLWVIGTALVLVGMATGTLAVSAGARLLRRRRQTPA